MKFLLTDPQSILSIIKRQEKQIKLKRRWLMGIRPSKSERKQFKKSKFFKNRFLPESLLREDDIFYESVRTHVEGSFGVHHGEVENNISQDDIHLIDIPKIKRLISACLDNLTTKGLYLLAMIVTGDSVKSEITLCNLKKIIKGSLSSVLVSRGHNHHQLETCKQLFQLLTNPQHFQDRCAPLSALRSQSYCASVAKVLHELENLPPETLIAMRRKLEGMKAPIPQLKTRKHGWGRDYRIKQVEKISREILSQLDGGNELPEPSAKAMEVAELSLKLKTGCHTVVSKELYQFSPEVKSLQNDIMNAIWSVKKVVTIPVLRNLQLLIEPKARISNGCLRTAFRKFLTEFLFECSDMDGIPKSLSQILDIISRNSNSSHQVLYEKKHIEDEVDCILSLSAQTKQIFLDLLPDHEFDQDFTDAYMDQLEESDESDVDEDEDDDGGDSQHQREFQDGAFNSVDSNYEVESIGEFEPFELHPSTPITEEKFSSCPLSTSGRLNSDSEKIQHKNYDAENMECKIFTTPLNLDTNQFQGESPGKFSTYNTASKSWNSSAALPDTKPDKNVVRRHVFYESDTRIDQHAANLFSEETELMPTKHNICKNQYLAFQDACDKTSMVAYNLIGHIFKEFAIIEGLDLNPSQILYLTGDSQMEYVEEAKKEPSLLGKHHTRCSAIVRVIKELIPSFSDSGMERLKMLMGL